MPILSRIAMTLFVLAGLCTLFFVPRTFSQSKAVTLEDLTRSSEVVAVGKVTETRGEWDQNKTRIVTRVTVAVSEYLKGNAGAVMTITAPGGEVDGVGEWYSHAARFKKDDDIVVFAEKDKKGSYRVAGGEQGKIDIKKDARTAIARVSTQMTLDDFKTQVKHAVTVSQDN
jgi:hypothetical protein